MAREKLSPEERLKFESLKSTIEKHLVEIDKQGKQLAGIKAANFSTASPEAWSAFLEAEFGLTTEQAEIFIGIYQERAAHQNPS